MLRAVLAVGLVACSNASSDVTPGVCRDGNEQVQRHGATCLGCHSDEFGVAGSVDPDASAVARVVVVDSTGDTADMVPNGFDNFFRHFPMTPPLTATVYGPDGGSLTMQMNAPTGDCNGCHSTVGPVAPIHGP